MGHSVYDCKMLRIQKPNGFLKNQETRNQKVGVTPPKTVAHHEEQCVEVGIIKNCEVCFGKS